MNRGSSLIALFFSAFLLALTFRPTFSQDEVGYIEKISGTVYWQQKIDTPEVKLDPKNNVRRRLVPGERYRCGSKGKLLLMLYGRRVKISEELGWFPIPYAAKKGRDPKKQTEAQQGAPGGRVVSNESKPTVQHPDGTFTVIEYPVKKEVKVMLNPVTLTNSKSVATILRDDDGTRIVLNLSDVPAEVTAVNLYAVDETGAVTSLGPVTITNGTGTLTTTTPLTKFMLIGSPEATLTTYDPNTKVFFRSAVPEGFAVIPHTTTPSGEKVAATTTETTPAAASYSVPMLNIPNYKKGDDTKMQVNFSGALTGARANVFVTPRKDGPTEVKLRFHELKDAPAGKVFTVWAVSPDNKFMKLGQIVNIPGRNEAEVKSEVALPDFGLLITMEDATATLANPAGPSIGIIEIIK